MDQMKIKVALGQMRLRHSGKNPISLHASKWHLPRCVTAIFGTYTQIMILHGHTAQGSKCVHVCTRHVQ